MIARELEASLSRACREMRAGAEELQRKLDAGDLPAAEREIVQRLVSGTLAAVERYEERSREEKSSPEAKPAS